MYKNFGNCFSVSYNVKHTHISKRNENISYIYTKNSNMNVHRNMITNNQDKMWYIHIVEYYSPIVKNVLMHATTWLILKTLCYRKAVRHKSHILYDTIYIAYVQKRLIHTNRKQTSGCSGLVGVLGRVGSDFQWVWGFFLEWQEML